VDSVNEVITDCQVAWSTSGGLIDLAVDRPNTWSAGLAKTPDFIPSKIRNEKFIANFDSHVGMGYSGRWWRERDGW